MHGMNRIVKVEKETNAVICSGLAACANERRE